LNKKGADVLHNWNDDHEQAFVTQKKELSDAPVLDRDDGVSELELQIDASGHGLEAVLQMQKNEKWRPITYISCGLQNHNLNII